MLHQIPQILNLLDANGLGKSPHQRSLARLGLLGERYAITQTSRPEDSKNDFGAPVYNIRKLWSQRMVKP